MAEARAAKLSVARAMEILKVKHLQREKWFPTADDLQLPDVPWDARQDVRQAVSFLGKIPITTRDKSWLIAQALTELNPTRIEYVEGLLSVVGENKITPSAWNLVDGHIVCLFNEAKNRVEPNEWLYEPLKIYPLSEIYAARKVGHPTCSFHDWAEANVGNTPNYNILEKVFKAPLQRMLNRKTDCGRVELNWE